MTILAQHLSTNNAWGTPARYVLATRAALGGSIDLDPPSDAFFNQTVGAQVFYTEADDGLSRPWDGTVFLNAPYGRRGGKSSQEVWSSYFLEQYRTGHMRTGILLANAAPGAGWFQSLWREAALCFPDKRVRFYRKNAKACSPTHDNIFAYLGADEAAFIAAFRAIGTIIPRGTAICKEER